MIMHRLLLITLFLLTQFFSTLSLAEEPSKVAVQLQWKHQFEFAGHYAAVHKGFYAKRGLQVELREYRDGMDVIDEVLSGRARFGVYHSGLIRARLEGKPVRLLANYFKRQPLVLLAAPKIRNLSDLRGKRLMVAAHETDAPLLKLALQKEGLVPGENIEIIPHSFNADPFLKGDVDAMTAFVTNEPFYLKQRGVGFNTLDLYGYMRSLGDEYLFTSVEETERNPRLVRDFVEATNEGWQYALENKEEIVDLILSRYSQRKSREALLYEARKTHDMVMPLPLPIGKVFTPLIEEVAAVIRDQEGLDGNGMMEDFFFDADRRKGPLVELTDEEREWIRDHPHIMLGVATQFPPLLIRETDGGLSGIAVDYVKLLNQRLGTNIVLEVADVWQEAAESAIERKTGGLVAVADTPAWKSFFQLSQSYLTTDTYLYVRRNETVPGATINSLKGKRVGYLKGCRWIEKLLSNYPNVSAVPLNDNGEMAAALERGEVDIVLAHISFEYWRNEHTKHDFRVGGALENGSLNIHFAIRNDWPLLVSIINKGLEAISMEERRGIRERWFGDKPTNPNGMGIVLNSWERVWLDSNTFQRQLSFGWGPFNMKTQDGKIIGLGEDYWSLIRKKLGLKEKVVSPPVTFAEVQRSMRQGRTDIHPTGSKTEERQTYAVFSDSYEEFPIAVATRKNGEFVFDASILEGKHVAVGRDNDAYRMLQQRYPGIEFLQVADTAEALEAVEKGDAFAAVDILPSLQYQIDRLGSDKVKLAGVTDVRFPLRIMIRKEHAWLAPLINRAIAAITPEERRNIHNKWMMREVIKAPDKQLQRQVILGALAIVLVLILWNRRMAREYSRRSKVEDQVRVLSRAADQSQNTIIITDLNAFIEYVNPAFTQTTGYTEEEVIGRNPRILQSDQHAPEFYRELWETLQHGEVWRGELCNRRKDGELYWESATISPVKDVDGNTTHYVAIKEDITRRKRDLELLRASEEKLRGLYELSPIGIALTDMQGNYVDFNRKFMEITGYSADELKQLDARRLTPPEYREVGKRQRRELEESGRYGPHEKEYLQKSGGRIPIRLNGIRVTGHDGKPYVWSLVEDVTEQKAYQRELERARETAVVANQAKSEFLANMSHEIRTPMNAILGMSNLALETRLDERQRNFISKVHDSAASLLRILNDILDFSKIEAHKLELEEIDFQLMDVVDKFVDLLHQSAIDKGLALYVDIARDVPLSLKGDPGRLGQILINLGSNAVKFTREGKVHLKVELLERNLDLVDLRFCMEDTGIGISADQQRRLFKSFNQADSSTSREYGGSGLGLAISSRLTEMMGGDIWIESEPGKGARFIFTARFDVSTGDQPPSSEAQTDLDRNHLRGASVLLVEDNELNHELALELLNKQGIKVTSAWNGREALEILAQESFDGVLMDVQMPGMDGYEATREIRKNPRFETLPILAMTANVMATDIEKALAAGMNDHIGKPLDTRRMFEIMARWITPAHPLGETVESEQRDSVPAEEAAYPFELLTGIDTKRGLGLLEGDHAFYVKMLGRFKDILAAFPDKFSVALEDEDDRAPSRVAHSLKGTAGNVGAMEIQEAAHILETICDRQQGGAEAEAAFKAVLECREPALAGLERFNEKVADASRPQQQPIPEPANAEMDADIETLKALLEDHDLAALKIVEKLEYRLPEERLQAIKLAVDRLDFKNALELLTKL